MSEREGLLVRVASLRTLWEAARRAARGKRRRVAVARTLLELEGTVLRLHRALLDGSWAPGVPSRHEVHDPKKRLITAAPFEDRIVHQALCSVIGPLLDRGLIDHTYACRVGKGTHAALRQARHWARSYRYALHLDVAKCFPSVDHDILMAMLGRVLRDRELVDVCRRIVQAGAEWVEPTRWYFPGDDLFTPHGRSVGLPIGNLTSQHFANRYLSPVDHRMKDRLRVRAYLRYMDDMVLFGDDPKELAGLGRALEEVCWKQRLRLHPWQVRPTADGLGFLGFRILPREMRVKRTSVNRARNKLFLRKAEAEHDPSALPRYHAAVRSVLSHWEHGTTFRLRTALLRDLGLLYPDADEDSES